MLAQVAVDPWERPYGYRASGSPKLDTFELFSLGPDGVASSDDIRRTFPYP